jgi:hypothetical protein
MEIDPATQSARDVLHRLDLNPILYAAGVSPDLLKPQQYLCLRRIAADISPNAKAQLAKINTHAVWEQATSMALERGVKSPPSNAPPEWAKLNHEEKLAFVADAHFKRLMYRCVDPIRSSLNAFRRTRVHMALAKFGHSTAIAKSLWKARRRADTLTGVRAHTRFNSH